MPPDSERSPGGDFLCFGCLEARLGRKLTPRDFSDAPINRLNPRASDGAPLLRGLRSYQERAATYLYENDSAFLIEVNSPRRWLRNGWKSSIPSSRAITTSPSIRNDCALRRSAASTIAGKRSAQSYRCA